MCMDHDTFVSRWIPNSLNVVNRLTVPEKDERFGKLGDFKKIIIPPTCVWVTYLIESAFTFTFASREFPLTCVWCIVCDSINRLGDLDL